MVFGLFVICFLCPSGEAELSCTPSELVWGSVVPTIHHGLKPKVAARGVIGHSLWALSLQQQWSPCQLSVHVSGGGVLWHMGSAPKGQPLLGNCPHDLFQSREASALRWTLSKTHFILESILSTAWKAASLLCTRPFLSNRECLSASKHLIKKATSLFKPFYFVWDGCLLLSLCSLPCRLRFRLQLTKTRLSLITYWGSRIPQWEPMYMFCLVMCELIWTNIANVAAILLFIAGLNVLWQHIQVASPRSVWVDWEMPQKCFMELAPVLHPPLI